MDPPRNQRGNEKRGKARRNRITGGRGKTGEEGSRRKETWEPGNVKIANAEKN